MHVDSQLRIEGDRDRRPSWLQPWPPIAIQGAFSKEVKEATIDLDLATGPWQLVDSKPLDFNRMPDLDPNSSRAEHTGIVLRDGARPEMVALATPTNFRDVPKLAGDPFRVPPAGTDHRFVAVLRNGKSVPLQSLPGIDGRTEILIRGRHGEDPQEKYNEAVSLDRGTPMFLASDIKEIRYEYRPIHTYRFEHVAVKPR
jgi:hypothetical protein